MTGKIGAVIFDMDGLMLDTERLARIAWDRALADWSLQISDAVYSKLVGRTVQDVGTILLQELNPRLPYDLVLERKEAYLSEEMQLKGVPIKPGLLPLLDWLDEKGIPKAIASSTFRDKVLFKLKRAGLDGWFQVIVCGDEVENGKPAPDIFLAAARRLNVPPAQCVVLEDSEPGILAAHAAGMIPIMVPDKKAPSPQVAALAHSVLPSLIDVKTLLSSS